MSRIGTATFQVSITMPVQPMRPRPQTVLRVAVSMGTSMPCTLRNETSSMPAITRKVSGMRQATSRDCSRLAMTNMGSPAK